MNESPSPDRLGSAGARRRAKARAGGIMHLFPRLFESHGLDRRP
jgi:hypothetical protein